MATQIQNDFDLELETRMCKGLIVEVSRRPGSIKLLIGLCWSLLNVIASHPEGRSMLNKVKPVLKMYSQYKRA